jgi:uncharacterized protein YcnI
MKMHPRLLVVATAGLILATATAASAHVTISPPVSIPGKLQLYSLAIPTEKDSLTTVKVAMTVPSGFSIDSFTPAPPGWRRHVQRSSAGNSAAVITRVTWTGGHTPTGEDSVFQFLADSTASHAYTFSVQQTYSDGSVVSWSGPESSDTPAPMIIAASSTGGSGTSTLPIVALIVGALGILAGGFSLVRGTTERPLA